MFRLCGIAVAITVAVMVSFSFSVKSNYRSLPSSGGNFLMDTIRRCDTVEWKKQKELVYSRKMELEKEVMYNESLMPLTKGDTSKKMKKFRFIKRRWLLLKETMKTIEQVEQSAEYYALLKTDSLEGETFFNKVTGLITLKFFATAGFVHEVTHAGQYERDQIAYDTDSAKALLQDLPDEVDAYSAQFAYQPDSVPRKANGQTIKTFEDIRASWVEKITNRKGEYIYADHGKVRVDIHSTKAALKAAYPKIIDSFARWPENVEYKDIPLANLKYKSKPKPKTVVPIVD